MELGLIASIAGVLDVGARVALDVATLIKDTRDAPDEVRALDRELFGLQQVLTHLKNGVEDRPAQLSPDITAALEENVNGCMEAMEQLKSMLQGFLCEMRLIQRWKFLSKKGSLRDIRRRLEIHKQTLSLMLGVVTGNVAFQIQNDVGHIHQNIQTILEQIVTTTPDSRIRDKLERTLTLTVSSIENSTHLVTPRPDETEIGIGFSGEVDRPGADPSSPLPASSASAASSVSSPTLKEAPTKDAIDPGGDLLTAATKRGDLSTVEMLLDLGADVNAKGGSCGSALMTAIAFSQFDVAKVLIDHGANDGAALCSAASHGRVSIAKLLLDRGADVNAKGGSWGSALMTAIVLSQSDVAKVLIDHGADARTPGALPKAAGEGLDKVVGWLLDANADVNADDGAALCSAASRGRMSTAKLLLDRGADVKYGNAILVAISSGHSSVAQALLQAATRSVTAKR